MPPARSILLRPWRDDDLPSYAAMNADREVMAYFPKTFTWEESKASMTRLRADFDQRGWGLWAVEVDGVFAGLTGLAEAAFVAQFTPCIEISWRFRREYWGQGIAFAAALAAENVASKRLGLAHLVSFTAATNVRSRRLMERLGFTHDEADDFFHPCLAEDSPLRPHVLYKKSLIPLARVGAAAGPDSPLVQVVPPP